MDTLTQGAAVRVGKHSQLLPWNSLYVSCQLDDNTPLRVGLLTPSSLEMAIGVSLRWSLEVSHWHLHLLISFIYHPCLETFQKNRRQKYRTRARPSEWHKESTALCAQCGASRSCLCGAVPNAKYHMEQKDNKRALTSVWKLLVLFPPRQTWRPVFYLIWITLFCFTLLLVLCYYLRQGLVLYSRLTSNSLGIPCWLQTHNPPASMLKFQVCTIMPCFPFPQC